MTSIKFNYFKDGKFIVSGKNIKEEVKQELITKEFIASKIKEGLDHYLVH